MTKLFDKGLFLIKTALVIANYTTENAQERMRPNPDMARFISASEMSSFAKEPLLRHVKM